MSYLIILLIAAIVAQAFIIRKGLKAAKKGDRAVRQAKSATLPGVSHSNKRVEYSESPGGTPVFEAEPQEASANQDTTPRTVEFSPKTQRPEEFAEIQREIREKDLARERVSQEQSVLDIIQEIRRGTARPEFHTDEVLSSQKKRQHQETEDAGDTSSEKAGVSSEGMDREIL
ncbi:MAG: hypothetical protein RBT80_26420, partial [Candidatus Vecturithrix sp.]|nr:hypothetical protein [Candidatus Vecturithrix sp.]